MSTDCFENRFGICPKLVNKIPESSLGAHVILLVLSCGGSNNNKFEPLQDKTNKMICAPSEDWDQPELPTELL